MTDEVFKAVEGLASAFEEFKANNDAQLREIKSRGSADVVTKEKVDRIAADVVKMQGLITDTQAAATEAKAAAVKAETALNRPGRTGLDERETKAFDRAVEFHKARLARIGQLTVSTDVEKQVDQGQMVEYQKAMRTYLRRDANDLETKALAVGVDPDGGFLVTPTMSNRIIEKVYETSPMRRLANIETIGASDAWEILAEKSEMGAGWVGELTARTETDTIQHGKLRIVAHEMYAKPHASQKMLEDAAIDIEGWVARKMGERFARLEATAFVSGDGVNKPRGLLTYTSGTSWGQIQQVNSGSGTDFTADGIISIIYALKEEYAVNASFLIKRASVANLMKLKDGEGRYLFMPSVTSNAKPTLYGYQINEAGDMPAVAGSALPLAFGDFNRAYTIVDRLGISILRDPYSSKPEVEFYGRKRVGGGVVDFDAVKLMVIAS